MPNQNEPGVSIVACTHLPFYLDNIFDNYSRQNYCKKELIVILNSRDLKLDDWRCKAESYQNVTIFQLDQSIPVGSCMNFAVDCSKYEYIANFDHDDYYGAKYLNDFMEVAPNSDAGLFGKKTHYVYTEENKLLSILHPGKENCYVEFIDGRTLFMKKTIFNKVQFINNDISDIQLSRDCRDNGIKIYSVGKSNFVYIRKNDINLHTWRLENDEILKQHCQIIGEVQDFQSYVDSN